MAWISDDAHAGGLVGVVVGVVFVAVGFVLAFGARPAPVWRFWPGVAVLAVGIAALVTGIVFVSKPTSVSHRSPCDIRISDTLFENRGRLYKADIVDTGRCSLIIERPHQNANQTWILPGSGDGELSVIQDEYNNTWLTHADGGTPRRVFLSRDANCKYDLYSDPISNKLHLTYRGAAPGQRACITWTASEKTNGEWR